MLVLALPDAAATGSRIAAHLEAGFATIDIHRFPDGEQRVRIDADLAGQPVVFAAALDRPDAKVLPLLFAADLARELGATRVGLVAPYLPFMRQDTRFRPGEAISARSFARLLSRSFDFLATAEPHLHRLHELREVFDVPARAVSAAAPMAQWIRNNVPDPVIVGPDEESLQWVRRIAALLDAPYAVMRKVRAGDRDVAVSAPEPAVEGGTPVLVDDIVSTGRTIVAAAQLLRASGLAAHTCVCVHALMDADALRVLDAAGIRIASCDSVPHASNVISLAPVLAEAVRELNDSP
ncbi:ribose-phosphate diphosphokinase [Ramlibacter sp.]|uniref:ribose-phosphate diphosphokinase n=1 Tax=Ramlibacter sp. TaxID=1917967 RepID=UPI003D09B7A8